MHHHQHKRQEGDAAIAALTAARQALQTARAVHAAALKRVRDWRDENPDLHADLKRERFNDYQRQYQQRRRAAQQAAVACGMRNGWGHND